MGVSGGVWECGKPERFSIISMPQSEGEKGEVPTGQLTSYAMPNSSLYMMKLDDSSVESASQAIKKLMEEK